MLKCDSTWVFSCKFAAYFYFCILDRSDHRISEDAVNNNSTVEYIV